MDLEKLVVPSFMASFSDRRFRTMFGLSASEASKVYKYLEDYSPDHFLWSLHFLKVYPTESAGACFSKASEETWTKWCRKLINLMNERLPDVSSLPVLVRFEDSLGVARPRRQMGRLGVLLSKLYRRWLRCPHIGAGEDVLG